MRLKNSMKGLAILLSIAILTGGLQVLPVFAGKSEVKIDKSSYQEKLDTAKWNNPDQDVLVQNGKLIIPTDSTDDTRVITVQPVQSNERLSELFRASATMKLTALPQGEAFIFAFGLESIEEYQGNPGNIEVAFTNQGGLKAGITAYDEDGEAIVVAAPVACGSISENVSFEAVVSSDNKLTFSVGGKTICNKKELPIESDGNIGFLQTGNCGAEISDVNISIFTYDTPENPDIFEDFETGAMNSAVFYSKNVYPSSYYPQRLSVQEMDGNHVLKFDRCGLAYIGTNYQYSNFELTFDVPYFQRTDVRNEAGEIVIPKTSNLMVAFGSDIVKYEDYGYTEATDTIMFPSNNVVSNLRESQVKKIESHILYNSDDPSDKGFSVKLSVIDAEVTVGLKWENEKDFTTVMNYMLPNGTPTGHVHIWSPDGASSFAIDNIKIVNKDIKPATIAVEYKCDSFERIPDFDYQDEGIVYRPTTDKVDKKEEAAGLGVYVYVLYSAGISVVLLAVGFIIGQVLKTKRDKKEKGGISDEI